MPHQVLAVHGLNRIPEGVGFDEASAAEPLACVINAQQQLNIEAGDTVVVLAQGPSAVCVSGSLAEFIRSAKSF